ncbi:MAG: hypothetical protein HS116_00005 [Planctomycetes bacterium]|nr:hypothetical protein [Planctomycetota bacterium]
MSVFADDLLCLVNLAAALNANPFRLGMQWGAAWAAHLDVDPQFPNPNQRAALPLALDRFENTFDHLFGRNRALVTRCEEICREAREAWRIAYSTAHFDMDADYYGHTLPAFHGNAAKTYFELTKLAWNSEWGDYRRMPATAQLEALRALTSDALKNTDKKQASCLDLGTMTVYCWMALYLGAARAHGVFKVFERKDLAADFLKVRLFAKRKRTEADSMQAAFNAILRRAAKLPEIVCEEEAEDEHVGFVSATLLAEMFKVPPEPLRKRLERFRRNNDVGWKEVEKGAPNDPRFLYDPRVLGPEIRRTYPSGQRPAKRNRRK